jgi:hypothetical protein
LTFCRYFFKQKEIIWIEAPIERSEGTFKTEMLIIQKKEVKTTLESLSHVKEYLVNITPSSQYWNEKSNPIQILGEH